MSAVYSAEVLDLLAALGLSERLARAGRLPCPACGKPRAFVRRFGWIVCNRRNACGHEAPLAPRGRMTRAPSTPSPAPEVAPRRPPRAEVERFWSLGQPLFGPGDAPLDRVAWDFLRSKNIDPLEASTWGLVKLAPDPHRCRVPWWPAGWRKHRLIVRAFEVNGQLASIHARAVEPDKDKTKWPFGCGASGLFFATPPTVAMLAGDEDVARATSSLIIVEGLTDFLTEALDAYADDNRGVHRAVLGVTSGSASALRSARLPRGLPVFVATDPDPAGDDYAEQIARALPEHPCRRVRLGEIGGRP